MPVPPASLMKTFWKSSYTYPTTKYTDEYVEKLFKEIERAWKDWQKGFSFGGLAVQGGGIGGWTGIGGGGSVVAAPYKGQIFTFYQQTKQQEKFQKTLYDTIALTLSELVAVIKFTAVNYVGSSSATPTSPGVFNAGVAPMTLVAVASKAEISGIGNRWKAQLIQPEFDLTHPQCAATVMVNAVASAVEKAFSIWSTTTTIGGSTAFGPAAPGAGTGAGTSQFDGILS